MQRIASILDFPHPGLSPEVWDEDGKLQPQHKEIILTTLTQLLEEAGLSHSDEWIEEVSIIGSITTYQYVTTSDIDIHIFTDLDKFIELERPTFDHKAAAEYLDNLRWFWNETMGPLPGTKHPIEFYFDTPYATKAEKRITGVYNIKSETWEKPPVTVSMDFDIEEMKPFLVDMANTLAQEFDISLGDIKRQVERIEELQEVMAAWPEDKRKFFQKKIDERIEAIDTEITDLVALREKVVQDRKDYKPESQQEINFKYLQRFGYLYLVGQFKDLLEQVTTITEETIPDVKKIVTTDLTASLNLEAGYSNFWISRDGHVMPIQEKDHSQHVMEHADELLNGEAPTDYNGIMRQMFKMGWTRGIVTPVAIYLQNELNGIPEYLDMFIWDHWKDTPGFAVYYNNPKMGDIKVLDVSQGLEKGLRKSRSLSSALKEKFPGDGKLFIDYDRTLVKDEKVIEGAKEALDKFKEDGWEIIIYSCRTQKEDEVPELKALLEKFDLPFDDVFVGKPFAQYYIDDHALQFTTWKEVAGKVTKEASLITAYLAHAYWIAPDGKIFTVRGAQESYDSHTDWISKNRDLLADEYGITIDRERGASRDSEFDDLIGTQGKMYQAGWVRIGDSTYDNWGVTLLSLKSIPPMVDTVLAQFLPAGAEVEVGDESNKFVSVEYPFKSLQQAVNKALRQPAVAKQAKVVEVDLPYVEALLRVIVNPSYDEALGALNRSEHGLRYLQDDDGNIFIWESWNATHDEVAGKLIENGYRISNTTDNAGFINDGSYLEDLFGQPVTKKTKTKKAQKNVDYDYSSTHVCLPKHIAAKIIDWGKKNIPDEHVFSDETGRYGREKDSHVTVKYGLLTNDAESVKKLFSQHKPVKVKFGKTRFFSPPNGLHDVVVIDVSSEDLHALNKVVEAAFEADDLYPTYEPHATVAYVLPGHGKHYQGQDILGELELVLNEVVFAPKDGEDVICPLGPEQEKKARLVGDSYYGGKLWFDPSGQVHEVGSSGSHADWILDHADFLQKNYKFDSSKWKRADDSGDMSDFEGLDNALVSAGWARVGDTHSGWGIQVSDLQHVPEYLIDNYLSGTSGTIIFEDLNKNWIEVDVNDFVRNGQKAVNKAIAQKRMLNADFSPSIATSPADNDWQFSEGGPNVEIATRPQDISDETTYQEPQADRPKPKSFWDRFVALITGTKKTAAFNHAYWIDPAGKVYTIREATGNEEVASTTHSHWVLENQEMLADDYGLEKIQSTDDLVRKGWTRIGDGFRTEWVVTVHDMKHLNPAIDGVLAQFAPEGARIGIASLGHWDDYAEIEWPVNSVQNAVNQALNRQKQQPAMASISQLSKFFKEASREDQIEVQALLDRGRHAEASLLIEKAIGREADGDVAEILKLIQDTGGATYNMSKGNLAGQKLFAVATHPERGLILNEPPTDQVLNEYLAKNRDLLNDETSLGVWVNAGKTYLDIVTTIPDRDEAIELGKANNQIAIFDLSNFQEIPTGGTGEVTSTAAPVGNNYAPAWEDERSHDEEQEPYTPLPVTVDMKTNDKNLGQPGVRRFMGKPDGEYHSNEGEVDDVLIKNVEKKKASSSVLMVTPYGGGVEFPVLVNPTKQQVLNLLAKLKPLDDEDRLRVIKGENMYVWDAEQATHDHVLDYLVGQGFEEYSQVQTGYVFGKHDVDEFFWKDASIALSVRDKKAYSSIGTNKYWINPKQKIIQIGTDEMHVDWIAHHLKEVYDSGSSIEDLEHPIAYYKGRYFDDLSDEDQNTLDGIMNGMQLNGWVRISTDDVNTQFVVDGGKMGFGPGADQFVAEHFDPNAGKPIGVTWKGGSYLEIEDPFPTLLQAYQRAAKSPAANRFAKKTPPPPAPEEWRVPHGPFVGQGWRGDSFGGYPPGTTALDVVKYEEDELGNDNNINSEVLPLLSKLPANRLVWVTKSRKDALKYGTDPQQVNMGSNPMIIGNDGEGGYLVLLSASKKIASGKVTLIDKPEAPNGKVPIVENPSPEQAENLFNKSTGRGLRWFRDDTGRLYMWDAYWMEHIEAMNALGIPTRQQETSESGALFSASQAAAAAQMAQYAASDLTAGNESTCYTDEEMEEIYDEQHAEDGFKDSPGGGNVYHDWNSDTSQFPKVPGPYKVRLDIMQKPVNRRYPPQDTPPYDVPFYEGMPAEDDGPM